MQESENSKAGNVPKSKLPIKPKKHSRLDNYTSPLRSEIKKKKKTRWTLKDYGKQKGIMWGIIFIGVAALIIFARAAFNASGTEIWSSDFSANFIIFLPAVIGFVSLIIGIFAPGKIRGILMILAAVAPWIYIGNSTDPAFNQVFTKTIHSFMGENFFPFFFAFSFAFMGNFILSSLRFYFPQKITVRLLALLPAITLVGFLAVIALIDAINLKDYKIHLEDLLLYSSIKYYLYIAACLAFGYILDAFIGGKKNVFSRVLHWFTLLFMFAIVVHWSFEAISVGAEELAKSKDAMQLRGRMIFDTILMFLFVYAQVGIVSSGITDIFINIILAFSKKNPKPEISPKQPENELSTGK